MNTLTIIFGFIGVAGTAFTIFAFYLRDRKKLVTYQISSGLSLVSVLPDRIGQKITVTYEKEGNEPVRISGAYLRYVRIANLGREPVTKADLVDSDPLRIEVSEGALLDLAILKTTRSVINFRLDGSVAYPLVTSTTQGTSLAFDFLDYQDGALIRVLTESEDSVVYVKGTIIGMPEGITMRRSRWRRSQGSFLAVVGLAPAVLFEIVAFTLIEWIFSTSIFVTGTIVLIPAMAWWTYVMWHFGRGDRTWPSMLRQNQFEWKAVNDHMRTRRRLSKE